MLPCRVPGAHFPSYVNFCGTDIGWILSSGGGQVHIWPLWVNRECSLWLPRRWRRSVCLTQKDLSFGLITYLPCAKSDLWNMWGWTTWGTQTHEPFVIVYISADSFAPRVSAPRQKQETWAEAQPLSDSISYGNLCRRQFSEAFTVPAGWLLHTGTTSILMPSLPNNLPWYFFIYLFKY